MTWYLEINKANKGKTLHYIATTNISSFVEVDARYSEKFEVIQGFKLKIRAKSFTNRLKFKPEFLINARSIPEMILFILINILKINLLYGIMYINLECRLSHKCSSLLSFLVLITACVCRRRTATVRLLLFLVFNSITYVG